MSLSRNPPGPATPNPRRWRERSLAFQLTAWYTTASFLLVALATGFLYYGISTSLRKISEQMLADELDVCRALVKQRSGDAHALHEEVEIDSAIRRYQRFYVRVLDEHSQPLATTPGMDRELSAARIAAEDAEAGRRGAIFWLESPGGKPYRVLVAKVVRDADANQIWTLQVAVDLTQEEEVLSRQRVWVWAVFAAAIIFCPWVGFVIGRRGTAPLTEVTDTARHISLSTLSERIDAAGYPKEIAALADTFNAMLHRLEESFAGLSQFSADIAHELRTPVNNIRGESEVALARPRTEDEYRDVLVSCLEESVRLSELIESLLFLARAERPGEHLNRDRENIGALLNDVRDYYEPIASETGVLIATGEDSGIVGYLDRTLIRRALGNLVSNALANTPAGGAVQLHAWKRHGNICIEIKDTGGGISPEALPRVFDRFYRADRARSRNSGGIGLGLAIVRQIISLHGGEIQIASQVGAGTTVTVTLPDAAPESEKA